MKMNDIDDDLLKELIEKCEDHMSSPYKDRVKKKQDAALLVEMEPEEDEHEEEEKGDLSDEIDPEMLKKLMEHYQSRK